MNKLSFLASIIGLCLFVSCKNNEETGPSQTINYAIMVMTDLSTNSGILFGSKEMPSGTISVESQTYAKQLMETRNGGVKFENAIYTGTNSTGESGIQKYTFDEAGQIVDGGFIASSQASYNTKFHIVDKNTGFYSDLSSAGLKIQTFNPSTMARTGEIDLTSVSKKNSNADIKVEKAGERMIVSKEGKLYVDLQYDINGDGFGSSAFDAVYAAVIDIKSLKFEKLIKYDGAQELAYPPTNLYMAEVDKNGDLYINTMGDMTSPDRNGKVLRIKKGETEFDKDFEISIDDYVSGKGVKWFHGGGVVLNGKIITGIKQTPFANDYSNFNEENIIFHTIDVKTKVATPIPNVPTTDYVSICTPFIIDGKVMIPYSNKQGSGIYSYDGTTAIELFKTSSGIVSGFYKLN